MDNNSQYKAIETIHSGYRFRSRLEARWAVFFEMLEIEYRYESEGFELEDGIRYLPDFYLPKLEIWIEIKPDTPTLKEREKAIQLCHATGQAVTLFAGDAWHDVKGHAFSTIQEGIQQREIKELLVGIPTTWLSTTECIAIQDENHFFGFDFHRKLCWSFAEWVQCTKCNSIFIWGFGTFTCQCYASDAICHSNTSPVLMLAYTAARQARF